MAPSPRRLEMIKQAVNRERAPGRWAGWLRGAKPAPYPRYASLEFLAFCPPEIAEFHRYWDAKRGGRPRPSRADIDPVEIRRFLPGVVLVDVGHDPLRLTYRLVGTREVETRGYDPTGKSVFDHWSGLSQEETLNNYRPVIEKKQVIFDPSTVHIPERRLMELGTILLPLSSDGATVDMVLIYVHYDRY